jgi:tetratricopeptide (TPR) repeat protein
LSRRTPDNLLKAIEYLERAIAKDPNYAMAHFAYGYCHLVLGGTFRPASRWTAKALPSMLRACELDDSSAEAHAGLGLVRLRELHPEEANKEIERAQKLDPRSAEVWSISSLVAAAQGRLPDAIRFIDRALEIEPFLLFLHHHAAWFLILARRYDDAIARCRSVLELDPQFSPAHHWLAIAFAMTGRFEEAFAKLKVLHSDPWLTLAYTYARNGDHATARRLLQELEAAPAKNAVDRYPMALVYACLGDTDAAFECLETAFEERSVLLLHCIMCDERVDPLRSDPRFTNLLARLR